MYKALISLFMIFFFAGTNLSAQKVTRVYTTKLIQKENFYFVQGEHHQCIEAVSYGIEIKTDSSETGFFRMDYYEAKKLKEKIGDADVQIEVSVFDKDSEGNGTKGEVLKISMNGAVIWERK